MQVVQRKCPVQGCVDAAKVHHQGSVDKHPHVVVALERERGAGYINEVNVHLHGEPIVVLESLIAPSLPIEWKERWVVVCQAPKLVWEELHREVVVNVDTWRVVIPLRKTGRGVEASTIFMKDWLPVWPQLLLHTALDMTEGSARGSLLWEVEICMVVPEVPDCAWNLHSLRSPAHLSGIYDYIRCHIGSHTARPLPPLPWCGQRCRGMAALQEDVLVGARACMTEPVCVFDAVS
mmetsp:Transcript_107636/g.269989  ORF Transcript_107636/g.269989 Transcript_107636/m.269989 type:complete len:235 (+) Transcript_107636:1247-1951(+)